jgi:hypothetical protein
MADGIGGDPYNWNAVLKRGCDFSVALFRAVLFRGAISGHEHCSCAIADSQTTRFNNARLSRERARLHDLPRHFHEVRPVCGNSDDRSFASQAARQSGLCFDRPSNQYRYGCEIRAERGNIRVADISVEVSNETINLVHFSAEHWFDPCSRLPRQNFEIGARQQIGAGITARLRCRSGLASAHNGSLPVSSRLAWTQFDRRVWQELTNLCTHLLGRIGNGLRDRGDAERLSAGLSFAAAD